jgi:SAM-dependent methyltransferase
MKERVVELIETYRPLISECAWHSLTVDPTLRTVSESHYKHIVNSLQHYGRLGGDRTVRVLEVASYAHTTGYRLQQELDCEVTLFDISAKALELGQRVAEADGIAAKPRLVAGDFHRLPFKSGSFDLVYISSALHHTWKYSKVVSELQRVLAPGGLLLLLNEPCHRQCCFYGFRTNRQSNFTKFESALNRLGIIRTFGEPYLGSRPETLFGMIENQMIPLRRLLDLLNSNTKIIELVLTPEHYMEDLERSWFDTRDKGPEALSSDIESTLAVRRAEAMRHFDEVAKGMKFHLPSPDQLKPFAKRIARALCSLPPVADQESFRIALSEIFGAAVQIVAEKPNDQSSRPTHTLENRFEKKGRIIYTFDDRIRRMLVHDRSLLPDIQVAGKSETERFFPPECWQYGVRSLEDGGRIIALGLRSQPGRVRIPACRHQLLLVLRYYTLVPEHSRVRIRIRHLEQDIYLQEIWQSESFLCVTVLQSSNDVAVLELIREVITQSGQCERNSGGLEVGFVGAFEIE